MTPADSLAEQQLPLATSVALPPQPLPLPHLRLPAGKNHSITIQNLHVFYGLAGSTAHEQLRAAAVTSHGRAAMLQPESRQHPRHIMHAGSYFQVSS